MIAELLDDPEKADAEKGKQLAEVKASKQGPGGNGTDGHYGPAGGEGGAPANGGAASGSSYAPKPVAHLIGAGGSP